MFKRKRDDETDVAERKNRRVGCDDHMLEGEHNTPAHGTRVLYMYEYNDGNGWKQIGKRYLGIDDVVDIVARKRNGVAVPGIPYLHKELSRH
jgi:hypothetical protein